MTHRYVKASSMQKAACACLFAISEILWSSLGTRISEGKSMQRTSFVYAGLELPWHTGNVIFQPGMGCMTWSAHNHGGVGRDEK